jgi:hypothetical protein
MALKLSFKVQSLGLRDVLVGTLFAFHPHRSKAKTGDLRATCALQPNEVSDLRSVAHLLSKMTPIFRWLSAD